MGDLPPLIGNPYNGYINPYYWVDDHPPLYGNNGSLDPSTFGTKRNIRENQEVNIPKQRFAEDVVEKPAKKLGSCVPTLISQQF